MAEEGKDGAEGNEEEASDAVEEKPVKKKKLLFIIGGILVLIVLIGAPLVYFLFMTGEESEAEKEGVTAAEDKEELVLLMEGFEEDDEEEENEEPLGAFYPFETFVVNLSGGGYLRCQAIVEFNKRDIPKKFYSKLVPTRDAIISLLSNKSRKDLSNEEGRGELKETMRSIINDKLRKQVVKKVYFTQFVIQ